MVHRAGDIEPRLSGPSAPRPPVRGAARIRSSPLRQQRISGCGCHWPAWLTIYEDQMSKPFFRSRSTSQSAIPPGMSAASRPLL